MGTNRIDNLIFIVEVDGEKIPSTDVRLARILDSKLSASEVAIKIRDLASKRRAEREGEITE